MLNQQSDTFFLRTVESDKKSFKVFEYSFYNGHQWFNLYAFPLESNGKIVFDRNVNTLAEYKVEFNVANKGNDFLRVLYENSILELPQQEEIEGYPDEETGVAFLLEYSLGCKYTLLTLKNPYKNRNVYKEANAVANFMEY